MAEHPGAWRFLTEQDLGMDVEAIRRSVAGHVEYTQAKDEYSITRLDLFQSLARTEWRTPIAPRSKSSRAIE